MDDEKQHTDTTEAAKAAAWRKYYAKIKPILDDYQAAKHLAWLDYQSTLTWLREEYGRHAAPIREEYRKAIVQLEGKGGGTE